MPDALVIAGIAVVLFIGSSVAVTLGFGSNVVALPLATFFADVKLVIPVLALLGFSGATVVATRERRSIDWGELRRILLWAAIGFPFGFLGFSRLSGASLDMAVGVVVSCAAVHGLWMHVRRAEPRPPHPVLARALLFVGGLVHGAIVTGGPLVVAYAVHAIPEKRRFRATLFALWVALNALFNVLYWLGPERRIEVFWTALLCAPGLAVGLWTGQKVHHRLPESWFRLAVLCLLLFAGLSRLFR
jgi:uncharacterized membrane protein YfcA